MNKENNKSQNKELPRRFNPNQYELLKKCSDKKDIAEWNRYRAENPYDDIELEEANFEEAYLEGVFLNNLNFNLKCNKTQVAKPIAFNVR